MDRLEENSSNFASDVGKYVQTQKRKAVFGGKYLNLGLAQTWLMVLSSAGIEVWPLGYSMGLFSPPFSGAYHTLRFATPTPAFFGFYPAFFVSLSIRSPTTRHVASAVVLRRRQNIKMT